MSALMEWLVHAYSPLAARHFLMEAVAHDTRRLEARTRDPAMTLVA